MEELSIGPRLIVATSESLEADWGPYVQKLMQGAIDVFRTSEWMAQVIRSEADKEIERRALAFKEISGVELPAEFYTRDHAIVRLDREDASRIRGKLISASVSANFCPFTGKPNKTDDKLKHEDLLICKLESLAMGGNQENRRSEQSLFDVSHTVFNEERLTLVRNHKVFWNPSIPWVTGDPDGVLSRFKGVALAPVEVKVPKSTTKDKSLGIIKEGSPQTWRLRKGHPWQSQVFTQILSMGSTFGFLAVLLQKEWILVRVEPSRLELAQFANNLLHSLRQVASLIDKEIIKRKRGRRKDRRKFNGRHICITAEGMSRTFSNLGRATMNSGYQERITQSEEKDQKECQKGHFCEI